MIVQNVVIVVINNYTNNMEKKTTNAKKTAKKISKKNSKNAINIDFTNVVCFDDIDHEKIKAIFKSKMSEDERDMIIEDFVDALFAGKNAVMIHEGEFIRLNLNVYETDDDDSVIITNGKVRVKKPNFFVRLWNRIFSH